MVPNSPVTLGLPSLCTTAGLRPHAQFTGCPRLLLDGSAHMGWDKDGVAALAAGAHLHVSLRGAQPVRRAWTPSSCVLPPTLTQGQRAQIANTPLCNAVVAA